MSGRKVAFLRAVNVGGRIVPMAALRSIFEGLGFKEVETFIASGNVVFSSGAAPAALEARIEKKLQAELGIEVATFIRDADELVAIANYQPFSPKQLAASKSFVVGFVAEPLAAASQKTLLALANSDDTFHVNRRDIYWISRVGQSNSTFSNVKLERTLKTRTTFRGMNTIRRLVEKFGFP